MPGRLRTEIQDLLVLALPLVLAQLAQMGMGFIDTVMVGRLGAQELAAVALGSTLVTFVGLLCNGTLLAVGPLASQAYGAGRYREAGRAAGQGLWLAVLLGAPATLLFLFAEPLLLAMGQPPATAELAASYLRAVALGFLPSLLLGALRTFLEAIGDTRTVLFVMVAGLVANVALNQALMFGRWGFPELGLVGAGYATALAYLLMFLLFAGHVAARQPRFAVFESLRAPHPARLRELLLVGVPIGLNLGFETGLFTVTTLLMGVIGQAQLAAHQIALQSTSFVFMVPLGLAIATSVRIGQAVGRGDALAARRYGYQGMALGTAVMSMTALLFWLAPRAVIGLFLDLSDPINAQVVRHAVTFLQMAAAFQLFDGLQVTTSGALRGFKDTSVPMLLSLLSYWVVGLSSALLFAFVLGWQGRGLWAGLVAGLACAALLLLARFRRRVRLAALASSVEALSG